MFKIVLTLKKRADLTRQQFIDHYEGQHTALVRDLVPRAPLYRRNFVVDGGEILGIAGTTPAEGGFDCMTELGFHTRAEAEAHIAAYLDPAIHPVIVADEERFIEPGGLRFYLMEVYQSEGDEPQVARDTWRPAVPA